MLNDLKKEIFRKSIHLCAGFVPFFLAHFFVFTITALSSVAVLYIVCEFLRLKGIRVPLISAVTETAARKRDDGRFVLGPVMLVLGIIATALIFQPVPASIGIYALAFGDGFASLAGKLFGKHKLLKMLKEGGRLVIVVGAPYHIAGLYKLQTFLHCG